MTDNGKQDNGEENPGGKGELLNDKRHTRRDTALIARAVKERWPIQDRIRENLIDQLSLIAFGKEYSPRDRVVAMRAILQADGQNQADEHKLQPDLSIHVSMSLAQVESTEARLGIESREWSLPHSQNGSNGSTADSDEPS